MNFSSIDNEGEEEKVDADEGEEQEEKEEEEDHHRRRRHVTSVFASPSKPALNLQLRRIYTRSSTWEYTLC